MGRVCEKETGLYYYGARYMNPVASLFLNPDRFRDKYPHLSAYNYCAGNPINSIDVNGDTLNVVSKSGTYLFTLDDKKESKSNISAKDLYRKGIQWFEPKADNYMRLLYINSNIKQMNSFKHFTWDNIIKFAEVDRFMISYRSGGSGVWKAEGKPGDGFLLVEVDSIPYWADAIGQIPYTLNEYRNVYKETGNADIAGRKTIEYGYRFGNGSLLNILFPSPDTDNNYDNAIIIRSINWAKNRYSLDNEKKLIKNDWPSDKMKVYNIIKKTKMYNINK